MPWGILKKSCAWPTQNNETRSQSGVYKLSRQGGLGLSVIVLRIKDLNAMKSLAATGNTVGAKLMLPIFFFSFFLFLFCCLARTSHRVVSVGGRLPFPGPKAFFGHRSLCLECCSLPGNPGLISLGPLCGKSGCRKPRVGHLPLFTCDPRLLSWRVARTNE